MKGMEYPVGATPLDPDELDGLKFAHVTTRGDLNHLEAANISEGFIWLKKQKRPDLLTDRFAREFHKKLFGEVWEWAGTYRQTEKNIGVDPLQISTRVRELMDDVRYWIDNDTFKPIETALRFHHKLVYIHPFPNGNGRHARYMANALMEIVFKAPAISWGSEGKLMDGNTIREKYIHALRKADQGVYDDLLDFVR